MNNDEIPQEFDKISLLLGELDYAMLKRIIASPEGPSAIFHIAKKDVYPKSDEEIAIWDKLTCRDNREALQRFVAYRRLRPSTDHARNVDEALISDSDRRASAQGNDVRT